MPDTRDNAQLPIPARSGHPPTYSLLILLHQKWDVISAYRMWIRTWTCVKCSWSSKLKYGGLLEAIRQSNRHMNDVDRFKWRRRMMTPVMLRWSGLSTEQLAIATIMSHVAQFEPRAHKSGEVKPFLLFNCYDKTRFDIFPLTMVFFLRSL
jgi:hypothetical protein